jgi:hypothetical protein
MQLENPAKQRRRADIIATVPDDQKANLSRRLVNLDRLIARRHRADADLADSLLRVLRSPLGKALGARIKEIANDHR